jgi:predicted AAA+ superfamily ATPase
MFPAVVILGPRQCGKTTLAQSLGGRYYDMETEGSYARLDAERPLFITRVRFP